MSSKYELLLLQQSKFRKRCRFGQEVTRLFWGTAGVNTEVPVRPQRGAAGNGYLGPPRAGELKHQLLFAPQLHGGDRALQQGCVAMAEISLAFLLSLRDTQD